MGFESRAISARVTKQIVTFFSKTCDKWVLFYSCLLLFSVCFVLLYYSLAFLGVGHNVIFGMLLYSGT